VALNVFAIDLCAQALAAVIRSDHLRYNNVHHVLHIKDMEPGEEQFFAEVGEGILDWEAIFSAAAAAGTQWLVVEQDRCRRPVFESIAISYRNLQTMGVI
jgi:sugar phosphate isomerase/epimerase